jgi:hypothetical protein
VQLEYARAAGLKAEPMAPKAISKDIPYYRMILILIEFPALFIAMNLNQGDYKGFPSGGYSSIRRCRAIVSHPSRSFDV